MNNYSQQIEELQARIAAREAEGLEDSEAKERLAAIQQALGEQHAPDQEHE